ncbi:MAG TPA: site-2 protease family protein [Anaerolineae bacterium]|nr:site-2 protease family protein [Anaerolineae bacterium]
MTDNYDFEAIQETIENIFKIKDITYGNSKQHFIVRYRGKLKQKNSAKAYAGLEKKLKSHKLLPLFREIDEVQIIILIPDLPQPKSTKPQTNLILFFLTLLSVLLTGGLYGIESELPSNGWLIALELIKNGWPFAVSLLTILAAHEFGHYFAGRRHGLQVTLPYFIPFPFSVFGTMGAFINMRSIPKNKRQLFDLAVTGPLCGLVLSIIVLLIGLRLSPLNNLPLAPQESFSLQMEGNSILYLLLKYATFGKLLPEPVNLSGISLVFYWLQFFFTAHPFPWGGTDVMLHQVAWAGWAGLLVTTMNLIPAGQLDGGHIFYALFGKKAAKAILPFILGGLALLGFFLNTWWLWAVLIFMFGRTHAEPLDQITRVDKKRQWLGVLAIVVFILTFIPVPISLI